MQGTGTLYVWNCAAVLKGTGSLSVKGMPRYGSAVLVGEGFAYALGGCALVPAHSGGATSRGAHRLGDGRRNGSREKPASSEEAGNGIF